jgi:nucleoside-diphosphate-sugar epimerase
VTPLSHAVLGSEQRRGPSDAEELEDLLSEPTPAAVDAMRRLDGDLIILGAGGKMGPTLARMARRASDAAGSQRRIFAVSRFSRSELVRDLVDRGLDAISADLLDPEAVKKLPDCPNVLFMLGRKFGTKEDRASTWAVNTVVPAWVTARFRGARTVAFSTGNVYAYSPGSGGGSRESDEPRPVGEYAMSALGRERVFEHASRSFGAPTAILRLNYAVETRYGVLVDIACRVRDRLPIDLEMGSVNVIWQADANAAALAAFDHASSPARTINVAGPEILRVRELARTIGAALGVEPVLRGVEAPDALLNDGSLGHALWGPPRVAADTVLDWVIDWIRSGRELLDRPTHFDERRGDF